MYKQTIQHHTYHFKDLKTLMAKASPYRSGDALAGICADSYQERVAAQFCLADLPLKTFLSETVIPYEADEITRLIIDNHNKESFNPISSFTVGMFRDFLMSEDANQKTLDFLQSAITPEMAAAVSKIMRNQDLVLAAQKIRVVTRFRNTIGLAGHFSSRLQPNHPTDDLQGIAASIIDGLMYGAVMLL
jgi:ethanolamine ammonia-lyase large subunit